MGTRALGRGLCVFTECVSPHSVTILMFNSSRRSLVLVKQFRPGESSWADKNRGWGIVACF